MRPGSFGFAWFALGEPSSRSVHLGSRDFTPASVGDVGLIRIPLGSLGRDKVSSGSLGFACDHLCDPKSCRVLSASRERALWLIVFRVGSLRRSEF